MPKLTPRQLGRPPTGAIHTIDWASILYTAYHDTPTGGGLLLSVRGMKPSYAITLLRTVRTGEKDPRLNILTFRAGDFKDGNVLITKEAETLEENNLGPPLDIQNPLPSHLPARTQLTKWSPKK